MIIHIFISIIILILNTIFGWLPSATVLPWGLDDLWIDSIGYFKGFMHIFPPLQTVFTAFVIYLGFRLLLITVKIFMGKRAPHHD